MKVLKFSGASVGSIANLQNVKRIVDEVNDSAVIVVSAVDGVTDWLFSAVEKATDGDATYVDLLQKVKEVHNQLIEGIIPVAARESLNKQMDNYFLELLAKECQVEKEDILDFDLYVYGSAHTSHRMQPNRRRSPCFGLRGKFPCSGAS